MPAPCLSLMHKPRRILYWAPHSPRHLFPSFRYECEERKQVLQSVIIESVALSQNTHTAGPWPCVPASRVIRAKEVESKKKRRRHAILRLEKRSSLFTLGMVFEISQTISHYVGTRHKTWNMVYPGKTFVPCIVTNWWRLRFEKGCWCLQKQHRRK